MEANGVFVIYRRPGPKEDDEAARFGGFVRDLGSVTPIAPGVWYVRSDRPGADIFPGLVRSTRPGSNLVVIDMTNDSYLTWPEAPAAGPGGPTS
jgi:hypothetical protein